MAKRSRADVKYAIDLLWTHQIRRENLYLHKQVQQIQQSINHCTEEQHELRVAAQNAETNVKDAWETIKATSSTIQNLQTSLAQTTTSAEATSKQVADFPHRFESLKKVWQGTTTDFDRRLIQNEANLRQIRKQHDETMASLKTRFDAANCKIESKPDDDSLEGLHLRVQALEQQYSEQMAAAAALSHVSESIEPPEVQCIGRPEEVDDPRDKDPTYSDGLVQEEEQMLTMRNVMMRDSTTVESLDLDANVSVPSYALRAHQPPPRDSLQPIEPTSSSYAQLRAQILALKQGRYHSHDRYLAEGQSLLDTIPTEQERFLVESFVRGLYSETERDKCRQWLQLNGWQWATVAAFLLPGSPSASARTKNTNAPKGSNVNNQDHLQSSSQVARGDAPLDRDQMSVSPQSPLATPLCAIQPRRSTRIAASQHAFRISQQQACKDSLLTASKTRHDQPFLSDEQRDRRTEGSLLGGPVLAAPSVTKSLSVGRANSRRKPTSAQQQSPPSAQPRSEAVGPGSIRNRTPLTPKRNISGFRATNRSSRSEVSREKRKCPSDWLTTESEQDDSTSSDQAELPTNPSPELEPRKRRKRIHHHNRQTMLPPPEIPILSTSE